MHFLLPHCESGSHSHKNSCQASEWCYLSVIGSFKTSPRTSSSAQCFCSLDVGL